LAIVRAVAVSHGGTVTLEPARTASGRGTRFVIRIPAVASARNGGPPADAPAHDQTSTTTGSTIGRRRSRS